MCPAWRVHASATPPACAMACPVIGKAIASPATLKAHNHHPARGRNLTLTTAQTAMTVTMACGPPLPAPPRLESDKLEELSGDGLVEPEDGVGLGIEPRGRRHEQEERRCGRDPPATAG